VKLAKPLLVSLLALALVLAAAGAAVAQGDEKVVLTVGLTQDLDSPNVTVGELVSSYELWNLHYATLTDKAADDFATIPGLAESWEASADGKTYTYTLREGLQWSDGTPLTSEDIAYTINRARDEEWINHFATVQNLTAEAPDERTVVITSKVPDPKLPTMDVYIVPAHVYEEIDAKEIANYPAEDGVGSGPFTFVEWKKGQYWRMVANPDYWGGEPAIDEIVFRIFRNADAMVAALRAGELDAAHNVPAAQFLDLQSEEGIVAVQGEQGGFDELALNGYAGNPPRDADKFGQPHPALGDLRFRQAIAHAIDKQTIVDRAYSGIGRPGTTISPSANPEWIPELTEEETYEFDLDKAKAILEEAGYTDSDGNGIREYEGEDIVLRYALRTESEVSKPIAEFVTGWLREIGIDTTISSFDDGQLIEEIGKGDYDLFVWGWVPFVDPDPMLSYFTCSQVSVDPSDYSNYYNDASWCNEEYDRLYEEQNQELDHARRLELVHEMLRLFYRDAVYVVLDTTPDLQAYRTDRFEGWLRQPAEIGPVIFQQTSPTYASLTPIAGAGGDGGGLSRGAIVAIVVAGAAGIALVAWVLLRRRTAEERE
jgi:peptide/nickel transport system substrate-binding protein